ncbi:MAG TPA: Uma2 family endonuclease [Planctomycetota bacterium]|nr:Uma2 family endonuclease [Planctomycetota bacterium]
MPTVTEKQITPEEMLAINDDKRYELIDGQLVEKDMGFFANRIAFVLGWFLETYLRQSKLGIVNCEGTYQCPQWMQTKVRSPDVSVVLAGRFPNKQIPTGHSTIAPDIAVEVISPNDLVYDVNQKVADYFAAGVKEVWLIDPNLRTISVRSPGNPRELSEHDILKSERLLPGFELKISDLFEATGV